MSAHRALADILRAAIMDRINDPGTEGIMDLGQKTFGVLNITAAGTRLLPASGEPGTAIIVCNTSGGNVAIEDSTSTAGTTLADNTVGIFVATGDTTPATAWVSLSGSALA